MAEIVCKAVYYVLRDHSNDVSEIIANLIPTAVGSQGVSAFQKIADTLSSSKTFAQHIDDKEARISR